MTRYRFNGFRPLVSALAFLFAAASASAQPTSTNSAQPDAKPAPVIQPGMTVLIEPTKQTEPPKPVEKISQDNPVTVQPTPGSSPPNSTSPTAPSTSKRLPSGVEAVAPGPSPIAEPGTLSSPPPAGLRPVAPRERYFMLVFGSQSSPKRPKYTHTWMTIVKAVPGQADPAKFEMSSHTISWMPRSLNTRVLALRAEPGVNSPLHETIRLMLGNRECLAMWGPYELEAAIAPQFYDKTLRQIARLNSGCVLYKAIDPDYGPRATYISNCIHAVTDLDGLARRANYDELRMHGFDASRYLAGILIRSGKVDSSVTHEWVAEALGLNCYPIQRHMIVPCRPMAAVGE